MFPTILNKLERHYAGQESITFIDFYQFGHVGLCQVVLLCDVGNIELGIDVG
jgi:hypothetical protein